MVIDIPENLAEKLGTPTRVALESLDQTTANALLENQKAFEKMSPEDIAKGQYTETQKMALTISEISAILKVQFAGAARQALKKVDENVTSPANKELENAIKGIGESGKLLGQYKVKAYSEGGQSIKESTLQPMGVDNKKETKTETPTGGGEKSIKKEVVVSFTSTGAVTDFMKRGMLNDPEMAENIRNTILPEFGDYTGPITPFV
jgi:hypothetical protein